MLVRADPETKSISMMSFPRDLFVQIHCPGRAPFGARINNAYATCGTKGTLETVRKLTGLPVNYLITVNFRGFRQLVDAIGGVWMDVDRRYFNDRGGDFGYATINLFPGYQKLGGYQALDFVRYRHTDSDLYRVARQQLFVRAFKDQVKASTGPLDLPRVIKTITSNVEVGVGGNAELDGSTVLEYALFAYSLPPGHFFQSKLEGIEETSGFDLLVPEANIQKAVQEFSHPDVESPQKATQVALNEKPKPSPTKAPRAARDDDHGPERERRHGLGRNRQLPALAACVPDGLPAGRQERERAELGVLQDPDPLRQEPGRRGRGGEEGRDALRHRRRRRDQPDDRRARERRDADRDRGPDLPRHARRGAGRQDPAAPACERLTRRRGLARAPARARAEGAVQGDGADGARALVVDRPREARAACTGSTPTGSTRRSGSPTGRARTSTGACR